MGRTFGDRPILRECRVNRSDCSRRSPCPVLLVDGRELAGHDRCRDDGPFERLRLTGHPAAGRAWGCPSRQCGSADSSGADRPGEGFLGEVMQDSFIERGEGFEFRGREQVDEMPADVGHVLGRGFLYGAAPGG